QAQAGLGFRRQEGRIHRAQAVEQGRIRAAVAAVEPPGNPYKFPLAKAPTRCKVGATVGKLMNEIQVIESALRRAAARRRLQRALNGLAVGLLTGGTVLLLA